MTFANMNENEIIAVFITAVIASLIVGWIARSFFIENKRIAGEITVYVDDLKNATDLGVKITNPGIIVKYKNVTFNVLEVHKDINVQMLQDQYRK